MSVIKYLKERWIIYTLISLAFGFSAIVYKLDRSFSISESNANYIVAGWTFLFIAFIAVDYYVLNYRVTNFKKYCKLNASYEELEEFAHPVDKEYAELVYNLVVQYEKYKADISTKSAEELEFITKWVHDVKVPISAARLILEKHENNLPNDFFRIIDKEIFSIEQSIQRVFYEIKSNTLYNDYKISNINTSKLIAGSLKTYSNFFAYKKINIEIEGEGFEVLTDEKWSGYILSQIISNAVKHTPYQGTIAIVTTQNHNETTIMIKNTGVGILQKDIGQVFNKGYTASEDRNNMRATGYGLYLSKKLSDLLGHRLEVRSQYGEYAAFSLIFTSKETIYNVTKM